MPQILEIINTYVIDSNLEINDGIKTVRQEKIFNYNQYTSDNSFEFKLFDNHLHYYSYIINYNGLTDNFSLNFSRSIDFPYGIVQLDYNSSVKNSLLQSKIIEIVNIYSAMIETSYRKDVNGMNYEINLHDNKLSISSQSHGYGHSGSGANYTYEEFLSQKKGQSFIQSNFDEALLKIIIKEI